MKLRTERDSWTTPIGRKKNDPNKRLKTKVINFRIIELIFPHFFLINKMKIALLSQQDY